MRFQIVNGFLRPIAVIPSRLVGSPSGARRVTCQTPALPKISPPDIATAAMIRECAAGGGSHQVDAAHNLNSRPARSESSQAGPLPLRLDRGEGRGEVSDLHDYADQSPLIADACNCTRLQQTILARDQVIVVIALFAMLGWILYVLK